MLKNIPGSQQQSRFTKWGPGGGEMSERAKEDGEKEREKK